MTPEEIDRQIAIVRGRLHERDDHHQLCSLKSKGVCDCYAREDMKAHQALDFIAAAIHEAEQRGEVRSMEAAAKIVETLRTDYAAKRDSICEIGSGPYRTASDRLSGIGMCEQAIRERIAKGRGESVPSAPVAKTTTTTAEFEEIQHLVADKPFRWAKEQPRWKTDEGDSE